ncbi:uncharacterized protein SPSK_03718 [Sporothrix schenckii 1099-18]|uniref:Uncharacterized protein n=1 Tax=Sporothrix schenckii 1099-18 TaxID=1397361 RepID=A0A0F2LYI1_SPOSC|nr:uncharacterized protein SPSK_03718 [Sporothrix schenckii 1099-18]KJR81919.1 hypothetical protein SPSK_03718 [Sporothrix schenckii 1099-18]
MAALLGATKGGQDRPQDRDDVPFRIGNSATTTNKNASSISAPPAAALSGKATSLPKTPTSSNDQLSRVFSPPVTQEDLWYFYFRRSTSSGLVPF